MSGTIADFLTDTTDADLDTTEAIDNSIADHRRSIERDKLEIAKAEARIKALEAKKIAVANEEIYVFALADLIHNKLCRLNHKLECDYLHGSWDDFVPDTRVGAIRYTYYSRAKSILAVAKNLAVSKTKVIEIFKML
jgi:hypothetical protein